MTQYTLNGFTATTGETEINIDSVVTVNYFVSPTSLSFQKGLDRFHHLLYVDSGEAVLSIGDESTILKRGQMLLLSPSSRQMSDIRTSGPTNLISISFISSSRALNAFSDRSFGLKEKERRLLSSFIREAEAAFDSKLEDPHARGLKPSAMMMPGTWQILRSCLELLLVNLYRSAVVKPSGEQRKSISHKERNEYLRMVEIISFLEENVHRKLDLAEICEASFMSRSALQKLFKQRTGESVMEYFITLKIAKAKKLLAEGRYSISSVSEMLGYNSIHYFSRQFKQTTGTSPREYTRNPGLDELETG